MDLIEMLKILGDETRIRILNILKLGELCVGEIEGVLGINQSNVSRHLNRLSSCKLISSYKKAQFTYYSLNEELLNNHSFIRDIIFVETTRLENCNMDMKVLLLFKENNISCESIASKAETIKILRASLGIK